MRRLWLVGVLTLGLVACDGDPEPTDAGPPVEMDAGDIYESCDPREVTCDAPMPMCGAGLTPIVEDGCWGPCLQSVICRPMMCTAATVASDCPMDWECVGDMCRPPRTRP